MASYRMPTFVTMATPDLRKFLRSPSARAFHVGKLVWPSGVSSHASASFQLEKVLGAAPSMMMCQQSAQPLPMGVFSKTAPVMGSLRPLYVAQGFSRLLPPQPTHVSISWRKGARQAGFWGAGGGWAGLGLQGRGTGLAPGGRHPRGQLLEWQVAGRMPWPWRRRWMRGSARRSSDPRRVTGGSEGALGDFQTSGPGEGWRTKGRGAWG